MIPQRSQVGDVVTFGQNQYLYGFGDITVRLTAICGDLDIFESAEWVQVQGVQLGPDGGELNEVSLLVSVAALNVP